MGNWEWETNPAEVMTPSNPLVKSADYVPGPTTATVVSDGVHPQELEPDGAGPGWRVATIHIERDGVVLATLQVTPIDIAIFPVGIDVGVAKYGYSSDGHWPLDANHAQPTYIGSSEGA